MTRREDPGWGSPTTAKRGNDDSMHVTNTTPQMQAFNAPIWLALEDYALQHAREDEMKISVFTGPYFTDNDPEMYGVWIPVAFWKVIAFIHDRTGKLCATGYEMNGVSATGVTVKPAPARVTAASTGTPATTRWIACTSGPKVDASTRKASPWSHGPGPSPAACRSAWCRR